MHTVWLLSLLHLEVPNYELRRCGGDLCPIAPKGWGEMLYKKVDAPVSRRYVRTYGTVRLLFRTNGLRLSFVPGTLGSMYPTVDSQFSLLGGRLQNLIRPEVRSDELRCGDVEYCRRVCSPRPMDLSSNARLRWGRNAEWECLFSCDESRCEIVSFSSPPLWEGGIRG